MSPSSLDSTPARAPLPPVSRREAFWFWLKLGLISFGGPAGQIALMHAELVERRRWLSEARFQHALSYCMVLPGPEAQQLATYIGWLMHRSWGGLVAGGLFVLPSLFLLIGLGWVYLAWGDVAVVQGLFAGLKPAVAALVFHAVLRMGGRSLQSPSLWGVAVAALVAVSVASVPFPAVVIGAALFGWLRARRDRAVGGPRAMGQQGPAGEVAKGADVAPARAWIDDDTPLPLHAQPSRQRLVWVLLVGVGLWVGTMVLLLALQGWQGLLPQMAWFFSKAALLTFGGAYAVLPYVFQGAVEQHHWVSAAQMMDGLALGETTPGPLIMVVAFVGFVGGWTAQLGGPGAPLWGGVSAALVVTWFTFLPSFVFILAGAPWVEASQRRIAWRAPLGAISAAVVGVLMHLALLVGLHVIWPRGWVHGPDVFAAAVAALALLLLARARWGVVPVLALCALAGWGRVLWL